MLIRALVRTPGTLLYGDLIGDDWSRSDHLLAVIADLLGMANWQRQGKKGAARPKPISPLNQQQKDARQFGNTAGRSAEEVMAELHRYRTGAYDHGG